MGLAPCAYSMTFNVTGDTLNAILNQRSQDMLTANNWNVCQYAALLIMFAKASGLKAGELVHVIADAHIYDRHIDAVKRIIEKEPYPAPEMVVEDITCLLYTSISTIFPLLRNGSRYGGASLQEIPPADYNGLPRRTFLRYVRVCRLPNGV